MNMNIGCNNLQRIKFRFLKKKSNWLIKNIEQTRILIITLSLSYYINEENDWFFNYFITIK